MKMTKKIHAMACCIAFTMALVISGCAGKQDRTYLSSISVPANVQLENLKSEIINIYISGGWRIEKESDHIISFIHQSDNMMNSIFFGSQYDTRVFNRETVVITRSNDGFTVRANQEIIGNYGSAFEKAHNFGAGEPTEKRLLAIRSYFGQENKRVDQGQAIQQQLNTEQSIPQQPANTKPLPVRVAE
ncbi:MAG: hypothetical protein FWG62_10145 [Proteobacteria bacterium]|nr:hypothetical protein [Pseudomonadota bacterium]